MSFFVAARVYVHTHIFFLFEVIFTAFYCVNFNATSLFFYFGFISPFDITVFSICVFILLASFGQLNLFLILNFNMKLAFDNLTLVKGVLKISGTISARR